MNTLIQNGLEQLQSENAALKKKLTILQKDSERLTHVIKGGKVIQLKEGEVRKDGTSLSFGSITRKGIDAGMAIDAKHGLIKTVSLNSTRKIAQPMSPALRKAIAKGAALDKAEGHIE